MSASQTEIFAGSGVVAVLLVDSYPLMREGIRALAAKLDFVRIAAEAPNARAALAACLKNSFDIALIGETLDDEDRLAIVEALSARAPKLRVIVFYDRMDLHEAQRLLQSGIRGLVSRASSPSDIVEALRCVAAGGVFLPELKAQAGSAALESTCAEGGLSRREAQVLGLLAQGFSNKDIANRLNLSVRTVETHRFNLRQKSGVSRPHELRRLAQRLGLLDQPDSALSEPRMSAHAAERAKA